MLDFLFNTEFGNPKFESSKIITKWKILTFFGQETCVELEACDQGRGLEMVQNVVITYPCDNSKGCKRSALSKELTEVLLSGSYPETKTQLP